MNRQFTFSDWLIFQRNRMIVIKVRWVYGKDFAKEMDKFLIKKAKMDNKPLSFMDYNNHIKYRCLNCGRDKFKRPTSHNCIGGFRKRKLKFEKIYL